jgi:hypothetical protein
VAYQESIWKSAHDDGCHTELANPSGELTAIPAFGVFTAFFCLWLFLIMPHLIGMPWVRHLGYNAFYQEGRASGYSGHSRQARWASAG